MHYALTRTGAEYRVATLVLSQCSAQLARRRLRCVVYRPTDLGGTGILRTDMDMDTLYQVLSQL